MQGASSSGCPSSVSEDENLILSSEDSSCPDETELELGLALSLAPKGHQDSSIQYTMTAGNFPFMELSSSPNSPSSSLSSSSSCLSRANVTAGIKRTADSIADYNESGQVVGWPPIRTYRMNSMTKSVVMEECSRKIENGGFKSNGNDVEVRKSQFVKVNMDGIPIGRKVDLIAHGCYGCLTKALGEMFLQQTKSPCSIRFSTQDDDKSTQTRCLNLLDGLSDFVLTFEDKDGDWMLVGDVPWRMFLGSVKRLRIMRTQNAIGIGRQIFN